MPDHECLNESSLKYQMFLIPTSLWQETERGVYLGRVVRREQSSSIAIKLKNPQNLRCPSCKSSSIVIEQK